MKISTGISHTYCTAAPANAQTKAWQRVWLFNRTTKKTDKPTGEKEHWKGNFENISFNLDFLHDFSLNCTWTNFEDVFIPYYEKIFGEYEKNHRFVNIGNLTFQQWKEILIEKSLVPSFPKIYDDLGNGEYFDFITNFRVSDTEGKLTENTLLFDKYGTTQTLTVSYLEDLD